MDTPSWHILRVAPNAEQVVAKHLSAYDTYVPLSVTFSFNRRFRVWGSRIAPIFAGMVFLSIPAPSDLRVAPSRLIRGFLRNSDRIPLILKPKDIDTLRLVESDLREGRTDIKHIFREGHVVEFREGVYRGFRAIVKQLKGAEGLVLELQGLGSGSFGTVITSASSVRATTEPTMLERAA